MPELFVYLLKVNLAIVLFYLVYHFLLRRLTFYTLNRYYLLFAFVFSAFYPLVNLKEWFASRQAVPEVIYYIAPDWTAVESSSFSIWPYLLSLFWAVVLFFLGRLALRLFSLWQIHRTSVPARWQYFHFRHVMEKINPFSFWKNIYVHVEAHQDDELMEIFNHEQVHVEQLHTVDTLLAEFFRSCAGSIRQPGSCATPYGKILSSSPTAVSCVPVSINVHINTACCTSVLLVSLERQQRRRWRQRQRRRRRKR